MSILTEEGIHFDKSFLEQGDQSESSDEEVKKERKPKKEKAAPKKTKPKKKPTSKYWKHTSTQPICFSVHDV